MVPLHVEHEFPVTGQSVLQFRSPRQRLCKRRGRHSPRAEEAVRCNQGRGHDPRRDSRSRLEPGRPYPGPSPAEPVHARGAHPLGVQELQVGIRVDALCGSPWYIFPSVDRSSPSWSHLTALLGTGTQIGDMTEATALGRVFRGSRSAKEPLYMLVKPDLPTMRLSVTDVIVPRQWLDQSEHRSSRRRQRPGRHPQSHHDTREGDHHSERLVRETEPQD